MGIYINGQEIDLTDPQALADSGMVFGGSIVMGDQHGVTGGTVTGTVRPGDATDATNE